MTKVGPNGFRYLVRRDGSLVKDDDGYPRPVKLSELEPESAVIVQALVTAADLAEREKVRGTVREDAEPQEGGMARAW